MGRGVDVMVTSSATMRFFSDNAELDARVAALLALPFETLARADLKSALDKIGLMEGATHG